jgi:hypothetical protein
MRTKLSWILCMALAACGGDDDEETAATREDAAARQFADSIADRVVGQYVLKSDIVTKDRIGVLGLKNLTNRTLSVADIRREGNTFVLHEKTCFQGISFPIGAATAWGWLNQAALEALGDTTLPLTFEQREGALHWTRAQQVEVVGANLGPESTELPTTETDPRVADTDRDDKPGATLNTTTGSVYNVAQRRALSYSGTVEADGVLSGTVEATVQRSILSTGGVIPQGLMQSTPNAAPYTVQLKRVAEAYDCARVRAEADALFGPGTVPPPPPAR